MSLILNNLQFLHKAAPNKSRVNIFANSAPGGGERNKEFPEIREEIGFFYCLSVKNREEIRISGGRNKNFWPKYLPLR